MHPGVPASHLTQYRAPRARSLRRSRMGSVGSSPFFRRMSSLDMSPPRQLGVWGSGDRSHPGPDRRRAVGLADAADATQALGKLLFRSVGSVRAVVAPARILPWWAGSKIRTPRTNVAGNADRKRFGGDDWAERLDDEVPDLHRAVYGVRGAVFGFFAVWAGAGGRCPHFPLAGSLQ